MASLELCWPAPMRAIGAQNLLTMPGGVATCGYLHKKGGSQFSLMKWPLRYIILHKGCVYYFKTSTSAAPQGAFSLNGYNRVMRAAEETTSSNVFPFKVVHFSKKHRTWFFSAASEDERRNWMRSLRKEIDHYNDRRDSLIPFDTDSDADSFYGSIEQTMDINHSEEHTEDDYMEEDDDEDDEDYVKPDGSPTSTGRPNVPPPAYPPPPVPTTPRLLTSDPCSRFHPGPLPPPVPPPNKLSPSPPPRNTPPALRPPFIPKDPGRKCPPPLPQLTPLPHGPPVPPPPNLKRLLQGRGSALPDQQPADGWKTPPAIGKLLEHRLLSQPGPLAPPASRKPSPPLPPPPIPPPPLSSSSSSSRPARPAPPSHAPQPRAGHRPDAPKPLQNAARPPPPSLAIPALTPFPPSRRPTWTPATPAPARSPTTPSRTPATPTRSLATPTWTPTTPTWIPTTPTSADDAMQRASPDGQSFRSLADEMLDTGRIKPGVRHSKEDSDEDYDNVQLPDSVFIDTTETSSVEKLFREASSTPPDGLYGIRNSGTKTSKVLVVWDVSLGKARNYRLFEEDQRVFLDTDATFLSLEALIEHYHTHPLPHHGSLCLQTPYGDSRLR